MINILKNGNCLELMREIPDKSIDLIICDLPYGKMEAKWDIVIPFDLLWEQYSRIIKDKGAILLFGVHPFTSRIVLSNPEMFKYSLIWKKSKKQGFAQAPYKVLSEHEDIVVFSKGGTAKNAKIRMNYFPQGLKDIHKKMAGKGSSEHRKRKKQKDYIQTKTGYPTSILEFKSASKVIHPTQKPIELLEYLIKTFCPENGLVLDNCSGSGSTLISADNLKRSWIGFELNKEYFARSIKSINENRKRLSLKEISEPKDSIRDILGNKK